MAFIMALQIKEEEELQLDIKWNKFLCLSLGLLIALTLPGFSQAEECTIGVASGSATADGRPMIWKTRDYISELDNEARYHTALDYKFVYVAGAGGTTTSGVRMGVNEHGLAIVNSTSSDLPDGSDTGPLNGDLIRVGLGTCLTVEEFQDYLDETNQTGRRTNGNFAIIDTAGGAAIFEVGEMVYWRFDAADDPEGYILRTNFAINGGGSTGIQRLIRTVDLVDQFYTGDSLNHKSILRHQMRDFSDNSSDPIAVPFNGSYGGRPYGYIETDKSICRNSSVSASVITGVLYGEYPELSTMWTILGQPATSIALPYWPIGYTPDEADGILTSSLCDISLRIRSELYDYEGDGSYIDTYKLLDGNEGGLWTKTFPYEDRVFSEVAALMEQWRTEEDLPAEDMKTTEDTLATSTYNYLLSCLNYMLSDTPIHGVTGQKAAVFPNPLNAASVLAFELRATANVEIAVYTLAGVLVHYMEFNEQPAGQHHHALGSYLVDCPGSMLLLKLSINGATETLKLVKTDR